MPKKSKAPVNRTVLLGALIAITATIVMTIFVSQQQTPPLEKPVAIRYALVDTCRQMAVLLYPDLSADIITNACYQEAIDLYDAHTKTVTFCYDRVNRTDLFEWSDCLSERGADFSGVYLDAAK